MKVAIFSPSAMMLLSLQVEGLLTIDSRLFPGSGAMVSTLTNALGRSPKVLGKPHQEMMDVIVESVSFL
jgi:ribonucleotide monophosphatase NagD (HAD superfamily)